MSLSTKFEKAAAIAFIALSVAIVLIAAKFPDYGKWETGPAMFPVVLGAGIFVFSVLLLFQKPVKKAKKEDEDEEDKVGPSLRNLLAFLGVTAAYIMLMPRLGFMVTTPVYVIAAILALGGKSKWHTILAIAVLSTLVTQYGFLYVFGVKLP